MTEPEVFGHIGPDPVYRVTLTSPGGLVARLVTYGARLTELHVPDRHGTLADIVLGYDTLEEYVAGRSFFGATCGRYANRIAAGQFMLGDDQFQLDRNENGNHLHGGAHGFDCKNWAIDRLDGHEVSFTAHSADGEMGYPGDCTLRSTYRLTDDGRLLVTLAAETTRTTPMNLVNHAYFNLAGQGSGDVLGHEMQIDSRFYTPVDAALLTTGEIRSVAGTPYDFSTRKPIGRDFAAMEGGAAGPSVKGGGYDHNWCLSGTGPLHDCVDVIDPASGRRMKLATSEPGVQFFTGGNMHSGMTGKQGKPLCPYAGFTLETQKFPGSPNHAHFPDCLLHPGQTYGHRMEFTFSNEPAVTDAR